ncbi:ribosome small subunit-dependent GTPase A [bacterium]|nr:ribosome small subunit-dependent GTPase A [bacterium]
MNMTKLGWDEFFDAYRAGLTERGLMPGRVICQMKKLYWVHNGEKAWRAVLAGNFFQKAASELELPAVGDWVGVRGSETDDQWMIREVLPRKTQFVRKVVMENTRPQVIAANIDTAFIVNGLDRDYNPRRIERYLALTFESGARPVVILNKSDICDCVDARIQEVESLVPGVEVIAVSAGTNQGIDQLDRFLEPGKTAAFLGSSGVGKSTLVNLLMEQDLMDVREVRENDQRGRHTTTHRELFILESGAMIVDTPGLRELQLWGGEDMLGDVFRDIEAHASSCRFSDCSHDQEPGCAVKAAVEDGKIQTSQYESYLKLKKELKYLDARQNEFSRRETRRQARILSKEIKRVYKNRKKP